MRQQPLALQQLNLLVDQLDADIARLAERYPWAFPSGTSLPAILATGQSVELPALLTVEKSRPLSALERRLAGFEEANGVSLLSYAAPTDALVGGLSSAGDIDISGAFALPEDYSYVMGAAPAADDDGNGGAPSAITGLLPITAALMAAREAPMFNTPVLTRRQVRDVLFLRDLQDRHGDSVERAHAALGRLVEQLQEALDGEDFQAGLCATLKALDSAQSDMKSFTVSGDYEESVWQRWTLPAAQRVGEDSPKKTMKNSAQVMSLSLANRKRLDAVLARWSHAKRRYASLVDTANRAAGDLARRL